MWTLLLLLTSFLALLSGCRASRCRLPWTGAWLENGSELNITHNSIGNLGNCVHRSQDLYLLTSETTKGSCYRCLITFPVHENVLHYKTTPCIFDPAFSLEKCAQLMHADTTMHTLFRKDAAPVPCPIDAPLNFTYQSSHGVCSSRTSHIHRCSQYNLLALHYQACPEIPNREAAVWQMECIGSWQSFGQNYFAARVGYRAGEQYRCFLLEKSGTGGRIGESADAGCQELTHIGAAATTISFKQDSPIYSNCEFPVSMHIDRNRFWESLVNGNHQKVHKGTWMSTQKLKNETVWSCLHETPTGPETISYRTFVTNGCRVGYQCVRVHLRQTHIVHIDYSTVVDEELELDCIEFDVESRDTLVLHDAQQACPMGGRHFSDGCKSSPMLSVGCDSKYSMTMLRDCQIDDGDEFKCIANFRHDDNDFIVVRDELSRQLYCMTYISSRINLLRMYDRVSCEALSINGAVPLITLNFTASDSCSPSLLSGFLYSSSVSHPVLFVIFMILHLLTIY
ncbi:unnamed protein product [Caenorhabditis bovis]|uniref:Uncharacterized protein n=1 Tax=Caenorhabditis bovis TaxID=2654633 RepID=A0A8S1EYT0_9PELO|nr:unnamed protein product [Caenorhabditis bovis]